VALDAAALARHPAEVVETHVSVIVLLGDRVFKLKKPVALPFVDWTDRRARHDACHREVQLNRRLAPDVYLGVADVVVDGSPCDHLVVMRRMPVERRLSTLVAARADLRDELDRVASLVARFHAAAPRSAAIDQAAGVEGVRRNWDDNLEALRAEGSPVAPDAVARIGELAHAYLDGRGPLFAERAAAGCNVDGHGDLLADDIYLLPDGPRILDCIDFSDRLRSVDVLDDVAFLAMDLERLGAAELSTSLVGAYERYSGRPAPPSLVHHFVAYRAGVRAKVACVRAAQGAAPAAGDARLLTELTERHLEAGRVRLVAVGGLPGTGKSTVASELAARTGWPVLTTDRIRKELVGAEAEQPFPAGFAEGLYAPDHSAATYRALLERARDHLEKGESVICDASWTDPQWRDAAAGLAEATASDLVPLWCTAPLPVAADRLRRRGVDHPSDATPEVLAAMAERTPSWAEATSVATDGPVEGSVGVAVEAVGTW